MALPLVGAVAAHDDDLIIAEFGLLNVLKVQRSKAPAAVGFFYCLKQAQSTSDS